MKKRILSVTIILILILQTCCTVFAASKYDVIVSFQGSRGQIDVVYPSENFSGLKIYFKHIKSLKAPESTSWYSFDYSIYPHILNNSRGTLLQITGSSDEAFNGVFRHNDGTPYDNVQLKENKVTIKVPDTVLGINHEFYDEKTGEFFTFDTTFIGRTQTVYGHNLSHTDRSVYHGFITKESEYINKTNTNTSFDTNIPSIPSHNEKQKLATPNVTVTKDTVNVGEAPKFSWKPVSNADDYVVWIWAKNQCYHYKDTTESDRIAFWKKHLNKEGEYAISVYAVDSDGKYEQSEPASFNIKVRGKQKLDAPNVTVGSSIIKKGTNPNFSWKPVSHADDYVVWVWKRNQCYHYKNTTIDDRENFWKKHLNEQGVYAISVYAVDDDGVYAQSDPASFNITVLDEWALLHAPDGRIKGYSFEKAKKQLKVGWSAEKFITLYAEGKEKKYPEWMVPGQLTVGWYTEPVQRLYAEGKSKLFKTSEVAAQLTVGWYTEPVQRLYAPGKSQLFLQSEVAAQLTVGWSTTPN